MAFKIRTFLGPEATADRRQWKLDKRKQKENLSGRQQVNIARIEAGSSVGDIAASILGGAAQPFAGFTGGVGGGGGGGGSPAAVPGFFDEPQNQIGVAVAAAAALYVFTRPKKKG